MHITGGFPLNTTFFRKTACTLLAAASLLLFCGCAPEEAESQPTEMEIITLPPPPTTEDPASLIDDAHQAEEIKAVMVAGELYTLDQYPNLKAVDLSGSTCYTAIEEYIAEHPHIKVTYTVDLGGTPVPFDASEATLASGGYTYEALLENLQYLRSLTSLTLPIDGLNAEQLSSLAAAYPGIALNYTAQVLGITVESSTTQLDLSHMESSQVSQAASQLALLPTLETVTLSNSLPMSDVAMLQDACPNTTFVYSFSLFGKTLSTTDTEISYVGHSIGNAGEEQLRQALEILDACQRFVLDDCGMDSEVLAGIREDFRDGPKVVWRVYFGVNNRYDLLTDADTIDAVYNVTDETSANLKYLEDVKYIDIGHNDGLTDFSFVQYMPELEILIASESGIKTTDGFENCKKLTWLELAYCYKLENIDALSECEGLRYLNISYSKITSLAPLDYLALERFVYLSPKASTKEQNTFLAIHPRSECITVFYGYSMPYSYGWRYDGNGKTYFWYYKDVVRKVFNYDKKQAILDAQAAAK